MKYSYNGVECPDINSVWIDKDTYPYAVITENMLTLIASYELVNGTGFYEGKRAVLFGTESGHDYNVEGKYMRYNLVDDSWVIRTELARTDYFFEYILWANFDLLNEDGSVYLAASEPVPVSPVKLNPALLVQSFFTGQALRRSRK